MRISYWSSDVCSANIGQGELPPLFVIGAEGDVQLVNYRVRPPYLIVDRLFGEAELRLGGKHAQVVRIERSEGEARSPSACRRRRKRRNWGAGRGCEGRGCWWGKRREGTGE